ncbi:MULTISPECIES: LacI family DNA-binding transcriptional regulator [Sphingomonas]|jgi:DNA-binding LacI/PurR family transcriptional regulator|uniref:LacI family DNA-binding transcriptional regulator n=1 Tax=Sphingomonas TaxID=13687 RepID=UPI000837683E|nr:MULTISPECIES: LacI family DNA-binding transcriptional regulator [Sphingomonas]MBY0302588.1 LacI family DNA-binding transcriptional regulator [Sphingomonas ginsenosidimutans]
MGDGGSEDGVFGDGGDRVRNMADLARLTGVHVATVSRALADSPLVSKATRDKIKALAAEHGFRPNEMARRLRVKRSNMIGVVVPLGHEQRQHLSDPFFMTILGHLADGVTANGYDLMLSRVVPSGDDWLDDIVDSGMLDGVLVIGQSDQLAVIERTAARYRQMVVWGHHREGQRHCAVGVDNYLGGRLAGERLIERGCRRIAFMGEIRTLELTERHAGVRDVCAERGVDAPLQLDTHLASDVMYEEIAAHWDAVGGRIDGIAAASDVIAMQAVRVLADRGVRVPDDIAITGFDDLPLAEQMVPRLTTVRQDIASGARAMTDALLARIAGHDAPSVVMTPQLVVRASA